MDVLIDTQTLIWFCENNPRLPARVRLLIESSSNIVVSIASFWEITIKTSLKNLLFPEILPVYLKKFCPTVLRFCP